MITIVFSGYPATGKTRAAKKLKDSLAKDMSVINISSLDIRVKKNLFDLHSEYQREEIYKLLCEEVRSIVSENKCDVLIVDGNFNKRSRREMVYSAFGDGEKYLIECSVSDEEIILKRFKERAENQHLYENKAFSLDLYDLIKNEADPVREDHFVRNGEVKHITFHTDINKADISSLSEVLSRKHMMKRIMTILEA